MDSILKEISIKIDSKLDLKLKSLNDENKDLFLLGRYKHFQSQEIYRQNSNLKSEVSLLENVMEERKVHSDSDQKKMIETYQSQFQNLKDDLEQQESRFKDVESQLKDSLHKEVCLQRKIHEQKFEIDKQFSVRKVEILEEENFNLIKSLNEKEEIIVKKELAIRNHQIKCPRLKRNFERKFDKLKKKIRKMKKRLQDNSDMFVIEKAELEKLITKKKLEIETEKLNAKLKIDEARDKLEKVNSVQAKKVQKYKNKYKDCQSELLKKNDETKEKNEIIEKLKDELTQLNLQNTDQRKKMAFLYKKVKKVDEIAEANKKWKSSSEKFQNEVVLLTKELNKNLVKATELESKLSADNEGDKTQECDDLKEIIERLKKDKTILRKSTEKLSDEFDALEIKYKEQKRKTEKEIRIKEELKLKNKHLREENTKLKKKSKTPRKQQNKEMTPDHSSTTSSHSDTSPANIDNMETRSGETLATTKSDTSSTMNGHDKMTYDNANSTGSCNSNQNKASVEKNCHNNTLIRSNSPSLKDDNIVDDEINDDDVDTISDGFLEDNNINFLLPSAIDSEDSMKQDGDEDNRDKEKKISETGFGTSQIKKSKSKIQKDDKPSPRFTESHHHSNRDAEMVDDNDDAPWYHKSPQIMTSSHQNGSSAVENNINSSFMDASDLKYEERQYTDNSDSESQAGSEMQDELVDEFKEIANRLRAKSDEERFHEVAEEKRLREKANEEKRLHEKANEERIAMSRNGNSQLNRNPYRQQYTHPSQLPFDDHLLSQLSPEEVEQLMQLPPEEVARFMQLSPEELDQLSEGVANPMQLHPQSAGHMMSYPQEHTMQYPPGNMMQLPAENVGYLSQAPNHSRTSRSHNGASTSSISPSPHNFPASNLDQRHQDNKRPTSNTHRSKPGAISLSGAPSLAPLSRPTNNKKKQKHTSLTGAPSLTPNNLSTRNNKTPAKKLSSLSGAPSLSGGRNLW